VVGALEPGSQPVSVGNIGSLIGLGNPVNLSW